jgi:hypothetical protein
MLSSEALRCENCDVPAIAKLTRYVGPNNRLCCELFCPKCDALLLTVQEQVVYPAEGFDAR